MKTLFPETSLLWIDKKTSMYSMMMDSIRMVESKEELPKLTSQKLGLSRDSITALLLEYSTLIQTTQELGVMMNTLYADLTEEWNTLQQVPLLKQTRKLALHRG